MSGIQDLQQKLRRSGNPATIVILALSGAVWIVSWLTMGRFGFKLSYASDFSQPWGIVTYPFASYGYGTAFVWILLLFYWFWWVASDNERLLGTPKFVAAFFAFALAGIAFLTIGGLLQRTTILEPGPNLSGLELVTAALTILWCVRNKTAGVRLFAVLPISGLILAWITVGIVLFGYGSLYQAPLMGVFACLHLGLAYLFAEGRIPGVSASRPSETSRVLKAQEKRKSKYYDDVQKRTKEREERARLKKLFEGSLKDDEESK